MISASHGVPLKSSTFIEARNNHRKMWYEILPAFGLVIGFLSVPPYGTRVANYFCNNGKQIARYWEENHMDFQAYLRDRRLTGSEYVPRGLEAIPDQK